MKSNLFNTTMRNGLVLGVLFSLNFIVSTFNNSLVALFSYLITALIVYLTYQYTVRFRDKESGGVMTFGQGFVFVFLLFLYASIISAATKYIFLKYINPSYLENMLALSMQTLEAIMPSVPEEMYDTSEAFLTPINFTMAITWLNFLMSLLVGLVVGLIAKRDNQPQS